MEKKVIPNVTELAIGTDFAAKQMQAKAGELMPNHQASSESILFVYEGECLLNMGGKQTVLKPGGSHGHSEIGQPSNQSDNRLQRRSFHAEGH